MKQSLQGNNKARTNREMCNDQETFLDGIETDYSIGNILINVL